MPVKPAKLPTPARGSKLMIGFGLVNVGVKLAPAARNGRTYAKTLCAHCFEAPASRFVCETHGLLDPSDVIKRYEHEGSWVEVDTTLLGMARDGQLRIEAAVSAGATDAFRVEKTYLVWPQEGFEQQFSLLSAALKGTGKVLIGGAVMTKTTKTLMLRWSDELGIPVVHVCTYDEQFAWGDVKLVRDLLAAQAAPSKQEEKLAGMLVDALPGEYAWDEVFDEWEAELQDAKQAAAAGQPVVAKAAPAPVEPSLDLVAALEASLAAAGGPKSKSTKKGRTK